MICWLVHIGGAVLIVLAAQVVLAGSITYSVAPILLPSSPSEVYDPNKAGQVVANTADIFIGNSIATTSGYTVLPLLGAAAVALNNVGQVTGINHQGQAFLASTSGYTPIPLPPGSAGLNRVCSERLG